MFCHLTVFKLDFLVHISYFIASVDVTQGKKVEIGRVLDAKGIVVYILIMNTTPAISNHLFACQADSSSPGFRTESVIRLCRWICEFESVCDPLSVAAVVFPLCRRNRRNFRDKWVKATKKKQLIVSVKFCWSLIYWSADKINGVNITLLMDKHWCYSFKRLTCDSLIFHRLGRTTTEQFSSQRINMGNVQFQTNLLTQTF